MEPLRSKFTKLTADFLTEDQQSHYWQIISETIHKQAIQYEEHLLLGNISLLEKQFKYHHYD